MLLWFILVFNLTMSVINKDTGGWTHLWGISLTGSFEVRGPTIHLGYTFLWQLTWKDTEERRSCCLPALTLPGKLMCPASATFLCHFCNIFFACDRTYFSGFQQWQITSSSLGPGLQKQNGLLRYKLNYWLIQYQTVIRLCVCAYIYVHICTYYTIYRHRYTFIHI